MTNRFGDQIMRAGMSETGRLHATTVSHASSGVADDPIRQPHNAIAAGRMPSAEQG